MGKYLYLQWKRLMRFLPGTICVVLLLLGGLLTAFSILTEQMDNSEKNQKFKVVICGDTDNDFLQFGISALQTFDNSRFSIDLRFMPEEDAAAALARGDIPAYVVIPEGFIEDAFHGNITQLKLVTTFASSSMVSLFKEEFTTVIGTLVLEAQKGIFGMINGFYGEGVAYQQALVDDLSIEYIQFVLSRSQTYTLQETGIGDSLSMTEYLLCGLTVLFLMLACLPFGPLMIRRDPALGRMLAAKGRSGLMQSLCDFTAYAFSLTVTLAVIGGILAVAAHCVAPGILAQIRLWDIFLRLLPAVLLVAALSFLLYSLSEDLISGVLLQFFVTLAMCFVCGCIYPVFFFPETVQKLARWLPAGMARTQISGCITGASDPAATWLLLAYSGAFFAVGAFVRIRSIRRVRG